VWISGRRGVYGFYSSQSQPPLTLDSRETVTIYTMDGPTALPVLDILPFLNRITPFTLSLLSLSSMGRTRVVEVVLKNQANRLGERFLIDPQKMSGMQDTFYNGALQVDRVKDLPDGSLELTPLFSGRITDVHLTPDELVVRSEGWG